MSILRLYKTFGFNLRNQPSTLMPGYQALAARKYDKPCSWCQKNLGREFYGHSVKNLS